MAARCDVNCDGGFGYTWRDSKEPDGPQFFSWSLASVDMRTPAGAEFEETIFLPFFFPFYGSQYGQVRITDNGYISFDLVEPSDPNNKPVPLNQTPNSVIAPLWDDLSITSLQWGPSTDGTYLWIFWFGVLDMGGNPDVNVAVEMALFDDGRILFAYDHSADQSTDNGSLTIGIESENNLWGIQNLYNGTGTADLDDPLYRIEYFPPIVPGCANAQPIQCGVPFPTSTLGSQPVPTAGFYSCSTGSFDAWETIYSFTVSETSSVTATLSDLGGRDLRLFMLEDCDANKCTRGDSASVDLGILAPGQTYYVAVDGPTTADNGTFTINLDCLTLSSPVSCGETVSGDTTGRTTEMNNWPCAPNGSDHSGAEQFFDISLPTNGHLFATVLGGTAQDVFILPASDLDPSACIAYGDVTAAGFDLAAGDYVIVVDGPTGFEGPFDLQVDCGIQLDCTGPQPQTLQCGDSVSAQIIAPGPGSAFKYNCDDREWWGPEHVWNIDIGTDSGVIINFDSPDGLGTFLMNSCDEGDCLGGNEGVSCSTNVPAGQYQLIVDSPDQNGGMYDLTINCIVPNQFSRWSDCEEPFAGTQPGWTVSQNWGFDDFWYCIDCPTHRNNPGTGHNGCKFAMYAVVDCGTEMHLPLRDVEAGRLRIYDVLEERYVNLIGQTPTWNGSGIELVWEDSGCADGDPCTAGTDPRFNNVVNDIHFFNDDDPGTAPVCGVFRMEFYEWGGFQWFLFANCTGDDTPRFNIYDNVCDALEAYTPRAELSVVNPSDDGNCPNVTLDFDITNTGCDTAEDFVVRIWEELDTGTLIRAQITGNPTNPPEARNLIDVNAVGPGATVNLQPRVELSSSTSPAVLITVDADDDVLECTEAAGNATSCRAPQGQHEFRFPVCDDCVSIPVASAVPDRVCAGTGPVTLNANGSTVPTCANGVPLEYNWTTTSAQPAPTDPNWSVSPTMDVPQVDADTTWYLWVRCQNDTECINQEGLAITVTVHEPPVPGMAEAGDIDYCDPDLEVTWDSAQFFHDAATYGDGTYNVYRGLYTGDLATDCANALSSPDQSWIGLDLSTLLLIDSTTTANEQYVYVVEAEDREPLPGAGGAEFCPRSSNPTSGVVASACVLGPAWDEVDLTPPDTDVGNTLRVTNRTPADPITFTWQDPRDPAETRERFRVNRSEIAYGPFTVKADQLDTLTWDDVDKPAILYYYEVRTVDTCLNLASDAFPPSQPPPPSCSNLTLGCGEILEADTTDCSGDIGSHSCFNKDSAGADRLHSLRVPSDLAQVRITITSPSDLDLWVYDFALTQCVNWGDDSVDLFNVTAGERFWVVVDGGAGVADDYQIEVNCMP